MRPDVENLVTIGSAHGVVDRRCGALAPNRREGVASARKGWINPGSSWTGRLSAQGGSDKTLVLQMALMLAVSARRSLSAVWTDTRPDGRRRNQPLAAELLGVQMRNVRMRAEDRV